MNSRRFFEDVLTRHGADSYYENGCYPFEDFSFQGEVWQGVIALNGLHAFQMAICVGIMRPKQAEFILTLPGLEEVFQREPIDGSRHVALTWQSGRQFLAGRKAGADSAFHNMCMTAKAEIAIALNICESQEQARKPLSSEGMIALLCKYVGSA